MPSDARADASGTHGPPGLELVATFARAILALVEADTDDAVVRAVASVVSTYGPAVIRLYVLHDDTPGSEPGDGRRHHTPPRPGEVPIYAELSSVWQGGVCPAEDPLLGRPFAVADHPVLARWRAAPSQPLVLHDLSADPRPGAHPGERSAQALVVLPLRVGQPARWPAVMVLSWKIVHIPSARERLVYSLVARVAASLIADRDDLRAHERAIDEANAVHVAALALAEATGHHEILSALAEPAQAIDASSAALWLRDLDNPGRYLCRAGFGPDGGPLTFDPPTVRAASEFAGLFARANVPWLFDQVRSDSHDDDAPAADAAPPAATLLLPLSWAGSPAAVVEIAWATPRAIPADLQRLYAAVAGPAAVTFSGEALLTEVSRLVAAGGSLVTVTLPVLLRGDGGALTAGNAAGDALLTAHGAALQAALADDPSRAALSLDDGALTLAVFAGPTAAVVLDTSAQTRAENNRLRDRNALLQAQPVVQARRAAPAISVADTVTVVPIVGGLDGSRAQQLAEVLATVPAQAHTVLLDFTGVTTVDAEAVPLVRAAARALLEQGAAVTLSGVPAGLDQVIEGERADSLGEALAGALVFTALRA